MPCLTVTRVPSQNSVVFQKVPTAEPDTPPVDERHLPPLSLTHSERFFLRFFFAWLSAAAEASGALRRAIPVGGQPVSDASRKFAKAAPPGPWLTVNGASKTSAGICAPP